MILSQPTKKTRQNTGGKEGNKKKKQYSKRQKLRDGANTPNQARLI